VGYAWVYKASGDEVAVELYDATAAAVKDTALYSTAGWATKEGADGNTWKRLVVSSTGLTSGNNHCLRIIRRTGDASAATTYYVDQCYLELGTSTTPTGWMSGRDIDNCYDYTDTTRRINYVDAAVIPGDVPAQCRIWAKNTKVGGVDLRTLWAGRSFGKTAMATFIRDYGGTVDATRTGGEYIIFTPSSTWEPVGGASWYGLDIGDAISGTWRILGLAYDTHGDPKAEFKVKWGMGLYPTEWNEIAIVETINQWSVIDLGTVRYDYSAADKDFGDSSARIVLYCQRAAGVEVVHIDAILAIPVDEDYIVTQSIFGSDWGPDVYLCADGLIYHPTVRFTEDTDKRNYRASPPPAQAGTLFHLEPDILNRYLFLVADFTDMKRHKIDFKLRISLEYRPRGLHFRGSDL